MSSILCQTKLHGRGSCYKRAAILRSFKMISPCIYGKGWKGKKVISSYMTGEVSRRTKSLIRTPKKRSGSTGRFARLFIWTRAIVWQRTCCRPRKAEATKDAWTTFKENICWRSIVTVTDMFIGEQKRFPCMRPLLWSVPTKQKNCHESDQRNSRRGDKSIS